MGGLVGVVVAVGVPGTPVAAQTPPDDPAFQLDTLQVSVGARTSAGLSARTRSVDILDWRELRTLPVQSVTEALRWAAGVDLQARSPAQADLAIRGSTFEQVLVLVDGVRMSDAQTGHFDLDLAVPLDQVERIEVLRGPASAAYGADAMGGVVNVVTRDGSAGGRMDGRAEAGSFGRAALSAAASGGGGPWAGHAAGEWSRSDGHRPGTDYRALLLRAGGSREVGPGRFALSAGHARRDFGADAFYAPFPSWEETRTTTFGVDWSGAFGPWSVRPRVTFRRHDDDFILDRDDPGFYRNIHRSTRTGGELAVQRRLGAGVSLAFGGEAAREDLRSATLGDRTEDRTAVFAEMGYAGARWAANAGMRMDAHEGFETAYSPTVSLARRMGSALRLRGAFGTSFRPPTWTDRYYEDPANVGSPDLEPERSWTAEVGADVALPDVAFPEGALLRATAFRRDSEDLIDWARPVGSDEDTPWRARNVEDATFDGLELGLRGVSFATLRLRGDMTLLRVRSDDEEGFTSEYVLRPMTRRLRLGVGRSFFGDFVDASLDVLNERRRDEASRTLLEGRVSLDVPGGRLFLDGTNLTGADYADVTGEPAPGRAFSVGLRIGR